jgi:hypothetical protein
MAWFVGQGMDPRQAIRMVERNEETWVGATGDQTGEWARGYPSYPAPHGMAFGKTLYHKAPMGKAPMGKAPMGKFPLGKGGFGKGGPGLPPLPYPVMQPWGMGNPYMVQGMDYDLGDQSGSDL